jgi:hypothetical protein
MGLFRRKQDEEHLVVVHDLTGPHARPFLVAMCSCGWVGPKHTTREQVFADAYSHNPNVSQELEVMPQEGYGFVCCFCGEPGSGTDEMVISASWAVDGGERSQWFMAHRSCFTGQLSDPANSGPIADD